jgi:hypothetical protein
MKSLAKYPDLLEPIARIGIEIGMLKPILEEGTAYRYQRITTDGKPQWDLSSVVSSQAAMLVVNDLGYRIDEATRTFRFETRKGQWEFESLDRPRRKNQSVGFNFRDVVVIPKHHKRGALLEPLHIRYHRACEIEVLQIHDEIMRAVPSRDGIDDRSTAQEPMLRQWQASLLAIRNKQNIAPEFKSVKKWCVEALCDDDRLIAIWCTSICRIFL